MYKPILQILDNNKLKPHTRAKGRVCIVGYVGNEGGHAKFFWYFYELRTTLIYKQWGGRAIFF